MSKINFAQAFRDIIATNKVIVDEKIDQHPPVSEGMQAGYNQYVKPLLSNFKEVHGISQSAFLKEILLSPTIKSFENLKFRFFGNWGRKVNPYIWAAIYVENDNPQPASHSAQLYVLIDSEGLKFGFDYGDSVNNSNKSVKSVIDNNDLHEYVLNAIEKYDLLAIRHGAGSPSVQLNLDKRDNVIKGIKHFRDWDKDIHIVKTYAESAIHTEIKAEIVEIVGALLPLLKHSEEEIKQTESDFSLDILLADVFINKDDFLNIVDILSAKKNIILQGPAGVGKTFIAKKIAQCLQGAYSEERIKMIQFHQSFSYEDFIQGYRPTESSFELRNGIFYEVCEKARITPSTPYFLIIDEINRGNLSKIFGELMMLIEADKRGPKNQIQLAYSASNDTFYVPDNVHIIGTMNTADRSLTIVDYALRRRFAFIRMKPSFDIQFERFLLSKGISSEMVDTIQAKMKTINEVILADDSLGEGFEIGHSYFCSYRSGNEQKWYDNVIKYEILPLIDEYWFDDKESADQHKQLLLS